jgi:glucose-6-phosphate isomerase
MESNGKGVDAQGRPVDGPTGPIVWGAPGTDAQHAFFQLIHQGTDVVPVEFLVAAHGQEDHLSHHHRLLLTNCLAQADALMQGRSMQQVEERLRASGLARQEIARLAPHRVFAGDRPSTLLVYHSLTPAVLGNLIALFEHRTVVEGALWGVNSFDQWGVELGKELATGVASYLDAPQQAPTHLRALISAIDELEAPE